MEGVLSFLRNQIIFMVFLAIIFKIFIWINNLKKIDFFFRVLQIQVASTWLDQYSKLEEILGNTLKI